MRIDYPSFYIGFDRINALMDQIDKIEGQRTTLQAYPPYNIVRDGENKYIVELAVAGFDRDQIDVVLQENILTISTTNTTDKSRNYVHRGIAERSFIRKFTLADTVIVNDVVLENGMLRINLENVIPEAKLPRKIEIRSQNPQLLVENESESRKPVITSEASKVD